MLRSKGHFTRLARYLRLPLPGMLLWVLFLLLAASAFAQGDTTDLVVLSTTDLHGKCWETNILTGESVPQNMLRVSTAVREIRQEYGAENVLLIDNGDLLTGMLPGDALVFSVHPVTEDQFLLSDPHGRYLTCGASGGLSLEDKPAENNLSLWQLLPAEVGYSLLSVGADNQQALEYYNGKIATYKLAQSSLYIFNFYEV